VELKYTHHVNIPHCKNCKKTTHVKKEEVNEIVKEEWVDHTGNYQSLLLDPNATFIQKQCLDSTPAKTINGLLVERPCWKEQYAFLRKKTNQVSDCDLYRQKNCILLESKCVQGSDADCLLWELTFECFEPFKPLLTDAFSHQELEVDPVEPNTSFNEVVAKLSVFKAMKEEMQTSQTLDPETLEVFKGSTKQCNKSIASDTIYDCCFAYSGLAKQIGLAKCDAEEIALATLREEGQCHYIGVKEDKLLDLVTTNYTHVYCCFPTKLARVFNEQARKQLNIGWGDAEHPNCQGLTLHQIQSLNFDQLQLEEVFDKEINELTTRYADKTKDLKDPTQAQKHIDEIKNKMKEKLKDMHEK
jgi:conjugal transfer mating pair stabilization protein TraN